MSSSVMTCTNCNRETPSHAIYCKHCGDKQNKECPDCAEVIKLKASVCRYCGYRFEAEDPVPAASPHANLENSRLDEASNDGEAPTTSSYNLRIGISLIFGLLLAIVAAVPRLVELPALILQAAEGTISISYLRGFESDIIIHFGINLIIWSALSVIFLRIFPKAYRIFRVVSLLGAALLLVGILIALIIWFSATGGVPAFVTSPTSTPDVDGSNIDVPTTPIAKPSETPGWMESMPSGSLTWRTARDSGAGLVGESVTVCGPVRESFEIPALDYMTFQLVENPAYTFRPFSIWIPRNIWLSLPQPPLPHFNDKVICATGVIGASTNLLEEEIYHLTISSPNDISIIES